MVRIKHRYLLLNILYPATTASSRAEETAVLGFKSPTPGHVDAGRFIAHLRSHITLLFGDFGLGVSISALKIVYFSAATSTAILRVPRNHHRLVWAALTHITELPGSRRGETGPNCVVRVVRVSGTIRKAEEELLRQARKEVVRAKLVQDGQRRLPSAAIVGRPSSIAQSHLAMDTSMRTIEDLSGGEEEESE